MIIGCLYWAGQQENNPQDKPLTCSIALVTCAWLMPDNGPVLLQAASSVSVLAFSACLQLFKYERTKTQQWILGSNPYGLNISLSEQFVLINMCDMPYSLKTKPDLSPVLWPVRCDNDRCQNVFEPNARTLFCKKKKKKTCLYESKQKQQNVFVQAVCYRMNICLIFISCFLLLFKWMH